MTQLGLYVVLSAALFFLGSRTLITRWLWSRYPPRLVVFMDCPACVGFWWGLGLSIMFGAPQIFMIFNMLNHVAVALCSLALTPIAAGLVQRGLDAVGAVTSPE